MTIAANVISLGSGTAQQPATATISYEGQRVSSVEIAGSPDLDRRQFRDLIAQQSHTPYSQQKVDQTISALQKAGQFQKVETQITPASDGLRVLFVLQPAYYFGVFEFGNATKTFTYTRLLQIANYPNQEPYTVGRVEEAESNLLEFFHQTGFFTATVEPKLQTDSAHGVVNVLFDVRLKRRAKFGDVQFTGASPEETRRLQSSLRSLRARVKGAYIKPGKGYSQGKIQRAIEYLQSVLGKEQYLAGRVELVSALYDPQTNKAGVIFQVNQGPKITIRVEGAHIWKRTQKKLIPMYQENAVDPDLVHEGEQDLTSWFQSKGYFDVKVHSTFQRQSPDTLIVYTIDKGKRGKVTGIAVHGNHHFEDDDLLTHVSVAKGHFFSRGKYSEQLLRKSVRNLQALYNNAGYGQAQVTSRVVNKNGHLEIEFQVQEGQQDVVSSFEIEGNQSLPVGALAPKGLNMAPGKAFSQQLMEKDRDQIMAAYLDKGYLTASFKATAKPLKDDPHQVQVVYSIYEGPEVHVSAVDRIGAIHTRTETINNNAKFTPGEPLSETALLKSESQLYTLGIFDWAQIDPRSPVTDQAYTELLIKLHESSRNSITYGVGFEVINRGGSVPSGTIAVPGLPPVGLPSNFKTSETRFWGPRGSIQYIRKNFLGRAETLNLSAFAGRLDQRASASWFNPAFWTTTWSSTLALSAERSTENPIFTSRLGEGSFQFQRYVDSKKTESVIFRYSLRRTNLSNLLIPDLVPASDLSVRLSTLSASFIRDTRDNALDAHHGIYESFEGSITPSALGSNTDFVRFLGQTAYYHPVRSKLIWANSIRLGLESAFAGSHVPLSERFFSGGGSTLRGFPLNGAGPQRTIPACGNPSDTATCAQIRVPVGGQQLVLLNSELRFPMPLPLPLLDSSKLGGVVFYDGGNIYSSVGFQNFWSNYTNTIGFGVRYLTPVGPVRLDIGHNLNPISGISATQIFVTFGQAF
ncbi:MAG TPA: POTRA domain-containing protein [Candidatus Angelobacter sp.]|nr:POTRA domain-containing protein [Candidatus Angelobacter sp.]